MLISKEELENINKAYKIYDWESYVILSNDRIIVKDTNKYGRDIDYTNKYEFIEELKEAIKDDRILTKEQKKIALSYL
ncbi:hypothetical protein C671_2807 [[Clostridium] bifermentans ATCC 19299]|uniref:hypothetical protein n=1 Tax=Paraclostridium bifermentans TaxID=1490 RepID=UPI00038C79AE|nr:hypothetical protein [Paraclostridium bifermentans]EQK41161.1 hypothetical protein C671_2807 [[Clostridium] bifermentans ATCC 19299] [Paraclostridium bifermentans ATCC 19299]